MTNLEYLDEISEAEMEVYAGDLLRLLDGEDIETSYEFLEPDISQNETFTSSDLLEIIEMLKSDKTGKTEDFMRYIENENKTKTKKINTKQSETMSLTDKPSKQSSAEYVEKNTSFIKNDVRDSKRSVSENLEGLSKKLERENRRVSRNLKS